MTRESLFTVAQGQNRVSQNRQMCHRRGFKAELTRVEPPLLECQTPLMAGCFRR